MKKQSTDKGLKATVFASALQATDADDIMACKSDMQKFAELNDSEAAIVANAIRNKQIPAMAKHAGLDEDFISKLISPKNDNVVDFADKKEEELPEDDIEDVEDDTLETPEDEISEESDDSDEAEGFNFDDLSDDTSEAEDEDETTATINIEVPTNMLDEVKGKLEEFFAQTFGNIEEEGNDFSETEDTALMSDEDSDIDTDIDDSEDLDDIDDEAGKITEPITRRDEMEKQIPEDMSEKLAQRKAYREQLLTRVAASEDNVTPKDIGLGQDTSYSGKPFQYSEKLQHEDEIAYPSMTMENSGGNSLKGATEFNKITVPTKNPDSLQLKDSYDIFSFDGGDDGTLGFSADFEAMNQIPSAGETATDENFEIPTQSEQKKRNTTVAKIVLCQGCDNPRQAEVETVECTTCGKRLCLCSDCLGDEYCPSCAAKETEACGTTEACDDAACDYKVVKTDKLSKESADVNVDLTPTDEVKLASNEVYHARLKTAYAVATQLAFAKVIDQDEVETQVELWINDGLSARAMKSQGTLMLRSAQSAGERVAASAAKSVRTASVNSGISTNPSFVSGSMTNSNIDLKDALSSIFMERFAE